MPEYGDDVNANNPKQCCQDHEDSLIPAACRNPLGLGAQAWSGLSGNPWVPPRGLCWMVACGQSVTVEADQGDHPPVPCTTAGLGKLHLPSLPCPRGGRHSGVDGTLGRDRESPGWIDSRRQWRRDHQLSDPDRPNPGRRGTDDVSDCRPERGACSLLQLPCREPVPRDWTRPRAGWYSGMGVGCPRTGNAARLESNQVCRVRQIAFAVGRNHEDMRCLRTQEGMSATIPGGKDSPLGLGDRWIDLSDCRSNREDLLRCLPPYPESTPGERVLLMGSPMDLLSTYSKIHVTPVSFVIP